MIEIDQKRFIEALNEVAASDSGKIVLAMLKDSCQWEETYLASDDPQTTQFYAVKRGIYGALRRLIKVEHLKEIEFNYRRKLDDKRDKRDRTELPSQRASKRGK